VTGLLVPTVHYVYVDTIIN